MRIHRIGQTKKVTITRFIVKVCLMSRFGKSCSYHGCIIIVFFVLLFLPGPLIL